jgi:hypothetical protein
MIRTAFLLVAFFMLAPAPHRVYLPAVGAAPGPLAHAAAGLLYPSETDSPLVERVYSAATPGEACAALGGTPRDVRALLNDLVAGDAAWTPLRTALLSLDAPLACRAGGVEGYMHLMGMEPSGRVVGVWAFVVET